MNIRTKNSSKYRLTYSVWQHRYLKLQTGECPCVCVTQGINRKWIIREKTPNYK